MRSRLRLKILLKIWLNSNIMNCITLLSNLFICDNDDDLNPCSQCTVRLTTGSDVIGPNIS